MKPRKTITRDELVSYTNSQLALAAHICGIPEVPTSSIAEYDDPRVAAILMNLFKDYRGFKIRTADNGATYAEYN